VVERKGGPTDPLTGFEQVFDMLFKGDKHYKCYQDYPLYTYLLQFSHKNNGGSGPSAGEGNKESGNED
jgi:hypothetical protein